MKQERFWSDLFWLLIVVTVIFIGDYRRRDSRRGPEGNKVVRTVAQTGVEVVQAIPVVPARRRHN